ncbi:hypothetical protein [Massilia alkalitolerans]|uniref:hypothetical protein n=1 Tax=Massilia alkalitolerans TaxID=286638 RepID=UPI00040BD864|nr:hypothetical protein [Massilia alkalitolerans]
MTAPVPTEQDTPLDTAAYRHQMLLLRSAHCARPVLYQDRNRFINGLSLYQDGGRVSMTVYLAGSKEGIDSTEIQIKPAAQEGSK